MKEFSYWTDSAPAIPSRANKNLPEQTDVVIIGGLLDPLSADLHVGKFVSGLVTATDRAGSDVHDHVEALELEIKNGTGWSYAASWTWVLPFAGAFYKVVDWLTKVNCYAKNIAKRNEIYPYPGFNPG